MSLIKEYNDEIYDNASQLLEYAEKNHLNDDVVSKIGNILEISECIKKCTDESLLMRNFVSNLIKNNEIR